MKKAIMFAAILGLATAAGAEGTVVPNMSEAELMAEVSTQNTGSISPDAFVFLVAGLFFAAILMTQGGVVLTPA